MTKKFGHFIILLVILFFSTNSLGFESKHQIFFSLNEFSLNEAQQKMLDQNIAHIKAMKQIYIQGYTDAYGDERYNTWLGLKRAETIRDYLYLRHRIEMNKIFTVSNGIDKLATRSNMQRRADITDSETISTNIARAISSTPLKEEEKEVVAVPTEFTQNEAKESSKIEAASITINTTKDIQNNDSMSTDNQKLEIERLSHRLQVLEDRLAYEDKKKSESSSKKLSDVKGPNDPIYELKINTYFADQSAQFDSSLAFNELLSEPRLSIELDVLKALSKDWSLAFDFGLRWNSYVADPELNTIESWNGFAYHFNFGFLHFAHPIISYKFSAGFDQILSHNVDTLAVITPALEPLMRLGFEGYLKLYARDSLDIYLGPKFSLISGINDITNGYSYGINGKAYLGKTKKYFVNLSYELNDFKQDVRTFEVETLELGLGIAF